MANIFCVKCGTPNEENYAFCVRCGAKLQKPVNRQVQKTVPAQQIQPQYCQPVQQPTPQQYQPVQQPVPQYCQPVQKPVQQQVPAPQPVQQQPAPTPPAEPAPQSQKKETKRRSAGIIVLSVFLSIFFVLFFTVGLMLAGVRSMMSAETVESVTHEMICSEEFLDIPARNFFPVEDRDMTVKEYLMANLTIPGQQDLYTEQEFILYWENSNLIKLFCREVGVMVQDVRDNTRKAGITKEDITQALYDDQALIEGYLHIRLSDADIAYIVDSMLASGLTEAFNYEDGVVTEYETFATLFSGKNMIIFFVLAFVCLLVLVLINKFDWKFLCLDGGISFTAAGAIACLPAYILVAILDVLEGPAEILNLANKVVDVLIIRLIFPGLIILIAGILLIATAIVLKILHKKKA